MKKIGGYFINGFLIFVPFAATVGLITWSMEFIDGLMPFDVPGVGLLVLFILIPLTGFLASNFIGKTLFGFLDKLLNRMPVVKLLYSAMKDLINALAGNKKSFNQPVVVELIENGPKAMGFITRDDTEFLGIDDHVAVYLPQSYNWAGQVLLFPSHRVVPIELSSSDVMSTIVSGGVSGAKNNH